MFCFLPFNLQCIHKSSHHIHMVMEVIHKCIRSITCTMDLNMVHTTIKETTTTTTNKTNKNLLSITFGALNCNHRIEIEIQFKQHTKSTCWNAAFNILLVVPASMGTTSNIATNQMQCLANEWIYIYSTAIFFSNSSTTTTTIKRNLNIH